MLTIAILYSTLLFRKSDLHSCQTVTNATTAQSEAFCLQPEKNIVVEGHSNQ